MTEKSNKTIFFDDDGRFFTGEPPSTQLHISKDNITGVGLLEEIAIIPSPLITFHNVRDGKEIGKLDINSEGVLTFEGDMDKSAETFFEHFLKPKWEELYGKETKNNKEFSERCRNSEVQAH